MAKELPFFKFEPAQWENGNIQLCSFELQGVFVSVCSMYWQRLGDLPYKLAVQKICKGNATALDSLISEDVIKLIEGHLCIDFLNEQLSEFENTSKVNSENARLGWKKRKKNAAPMPPHSDPNAIRGEERRLDNTLREAVCEIFGKTYQLPLDRMPQMANWYSTIDLECDKILKVYTDVTEATRQVKAYIKLCRDQKRKLIGTNYKVSETILSSDWIKLLTPMGGTGSGIKVGETRKVHAG